MCSSYWNLTADFTCPACGWWNDDEELQTHWLGEPGSCLNRYRIGEPVAELAGVKSAEMGDRKAGAPDDLAGGCDGCAVWIDFGARIENSAVIEVWPYRWHDDDGREHVVQKAVEAA